MPSESFEVINQPWTKKFAFFPKTVNKKIIWLSSYYERIITTIFDMNIPTGELWGETMSNTRIERKNNIYEIIMGNKN